MPTIALGPAKGGRLATVKQKHTEKSQHKQNQKHKQEHKHKRKHKHKDKHKHKHKRGTRQPLPVPSLFRSSDPPCNEVATFLCVRNFGRESYGPRVSPV